ncbi:hypothetical protein [Sphingomonas sp. Leaf343]|uniref:hypothetical protein n=1 Tax=Sphingomonas sp. Leaf343 TaxID=1736345 RepID=UPI0006F4C0C4|nr:hypothetical protein [Sphingomonas sp. Leaf343]KQR80522.1 hypothetical protein ASG07_15390 [Sphingomonas sp. Leaf343]
MSATFQPSNVLIVGAGFSKNAGLPLVSDFTKELLNLRRLRLDGPNGVLVRFIRQFVDTSFGEGAARTPDQWPDLEDLFTLVDLAANSGHHLGPAYPAARLRLVRRAIIARMIRMLDRAYNDGVRAGGSDREALDSVIAELNLDDVSVLSMNWDTVIERDLASRRLLTNFDYGCGARRAAFRDGKLAERPLPNAATVEILKPHGSVNWLYCDACRNIYWLIPDEGSRVARTFFRQADWEAIGADSRTSGPARLAQTCPSCEADALGTRFATFSYRKALDFPMFAASWRTAEERLKRAADWVFVGYSLPAADFEFKHLLKRIQLSEGERPRITVVTKGFAGEETINRYEKFFGTVSSERTYLRNGFDRQAVEHLRRIRVLGSSPS